MIEHIIHIGEKQFKFILNCEQNKIYCISNDHFKYDPVYGWTKFDDNGYYQASFEEMKQLNIVLKIVLKQDDVFNNMFFVICGKIAFEREQLK